MLTVSTLLPVAPALASQSSAMFDRSKVVTLAGVIKEFQYADPHSLLFIDVTDADGKITTWKFEAEGSGTLMRAGIHQGDLLPGTRVTIKGNPMRDGRPAANWIELIRNQDGKVFNPHRDSQSK